MTPLSLRGLLAVCASNSAITGIAVAPSGEIYIEGQFDDTIDFGNGATLSDVGAADTFGNRCTAPVLGADL